MNYCENFKAIVTASDENKKQILMARTRCKQWTCSYCAEINKKIWQARILEHINKNTDLQWSWFTLTAHGKKRGKRKSLQNLRSAWDALLKRIKRHFKAVEKLHYVRVFEQHKDGSYHLHCILSAHWTDLKIRISKDGKQTSHSTWLDKQAKDMKIGYYTHAANFEGKHAGYIAGYVTKYMTKVSFEMDKELGRIRHIQTSQGWTQFNNETMYKWAITSGMYSKDVLHAVKIGYEIIDIQEQKVVTFDDFLDYHVYPNEFDSDFEENNKNLT